MFIEAKNYELVIESYDSDDWKIILDLIPTIEGTSVFGERLGNTTRHDGVIEIGGYNDARIVRDLEECAYAIPIMIHFNWMDWSEGYDIIDNPDYDLNLLSLTQLCKIITMLIRMDRFGEGTLAHYFETGLVLKVLRSISQKINVD